MSYKTENGTATVTCDKCGTWDKTSETKAGEIFFSLGWAYSPNARKYKHRCRDCQSAKERRAHDFVNKKFKL